MKAPVAALALMLCAFSYEAIAATMEYPAHGIAIDLPDGYLQQERRDAAGTDILSFSSTDVDAPVITLSLIPLEAGYRDRAALFEAQAGAVEEVLGGPAEVDRLEDFDLGHAPARWGWLERPAGSASSMIGIGAVELAAVQVALAVVMTDAACDHWAEPIETAFLSIRGLGEAIAEVRGRTKVSRPANRAQTPPSS